MTKSGIYIHIPFCKRKCAYCNFYSLTMYENLMDGYLSALVGDMKAKGGRTDRLFDTVYIGGGTPSLLEKKIAGLIGAVKESFNITENAEITAEVNPDVSDEFFKTAFESGINRISIGIQSADDQRLKLLGRTHTKAEAENAVAFVEPEAGAAPTVELTAPKAPQRVEIETGTELEEVQPLMAAKPVPVDELVTIEPLPTKEMERELMAKMEGQIPLDEEERERERITQPEDMT